MKTKWDVTHLYENEEAWKKDLKSLKDKIKELNAIENNFCQSEESCNQFLNQFYDAHCLLEKVYIYPRRMLDTDDKNHEAADMFNEALSCYEKINSVEKQMHQQIIANKEKVQTYQKVLAQHKMVIEKILEEKNEKAEMMLPWLDMGIKKLYMNMTGRDFAFHYSIRYQNKKTLVTFQNINQLMKDENQNIREKAYHAMIKNYQERENSMASLLDLKYTNEIKVANQKGYQSLEQQRFMPLHIPENFVQNFINSIKPYSTLLQRYHKIRKERLQVKALHSYDFAGDLGNVPSKKYEVEEALDMIKKSLTCLGNDYASLVEKAKEEGWMDIYPSEGKRKGSYSCISYNGVPYLLVNYKKDFYSVRTLAHELGHSFHTYYATTTQPYENFEYDFLLAEISSKVHEILINEALLEDTTDKEAKINLLSNIISSYKNTLFNCTLISEFETKLLQEKYANKALTATWLNKTYESLYHEYYPDVKTKPCIGNEWQRISHLFMNEGLYTILYPIGLCIATHVAHELKNGNEQMVTAYKNYLKAGGSIPVKDALAILGVNIENLSFIDGAMRYLEEKIEELEKQIEKL